MTGPELAPVLDALDTLASRGWPTTRLRQIIADDALKCERCRRGYAALVLWHAANPDARGRIELAEADYAVTQALSYPHTCAHGRNGGACRVQSRP